MSSPLRLEQQAATRRRLLDAAHACFLEHGFYDTTVDAIARRAGTSRATFYLHFPSKSHALAATWDELDLPEVDQLMRDHDARGDFSAAATRAWLDTLLEYWERNRNVGLAANQAVAFEPVLLDRWVENMTHVPADLPKMRERLGGGAATSDRLLLQAIQLERTSFLWVHGHLALSRDRLLDALTAVWAVED
jgi:AcrR family transcriptional regulator